MSDAKHKPGDQVHYLDGCHATEGTVVSVDDGFVDVKETTSCGLISKMLLSLNVYRHDDIKGFASYLREQAEWLRQQADKLEGKWQSQKKG